MSEAPPLPAPLLAFADRWLARVLSTDPQVRAELGALAGRSILIELRGLNRSLLLLPDAEAGLRLVAASELPVGVRIAGTPLALAGLMRGGAAGGEGGSGVEVSGDLALSQRLQRALGRLDVDWEELAARRIGDFPARRLSAATRRFAAWLGSTRQTLEQDVSEYARHEVNWLPTREEVGGYLEEVDRLRMATDRLEQRIRRLRLRRQSAG